MEEEAEKTIVVNYNQHPDYVDNEGILNLLLGKIWSMRKFGELFPGHQVGWDFMNECFTDGLERGLQVKRKHDCVEYENLVPF
jgi:hypothetical protein